MAPQVGLEPTTLRLTAGCSAIELLRSVALRVRTGVERDAIFKVIISRGVDKRRLKNDEWKDSSQHLDGRGWWWDTRDSSGLKALRNDAGKAAGGAWGFLGKAQ